MKHDFKAALDWVAETTAPVKMPSGFTIEPTKESKDNIKTIQFALEFTDRALNGEVTRICMGVGADEFDLPENVDNIFEAMAAQLAKEVEGV